MHLCTLNSLTDMEIIPYHTYTMKTLPVCGPPKPTNISRTDVKHKRIFQSIIYSMSGTFVSSSDSWLLYSLIRRHTPQSNSTEHNRLTTSLDVPLFLLQMLRVINSSSVYNSWCHNSKHVENKKRIKTEEVKYLLYSVI